MYSWPCRSSSQARRKKPRLYSRQTRSRFEEALDIGPEGRGLALPCARRRGHRCHRGLDALVERPRGPSELDLLASKLLGERFLARAEVRYLRWH